LAAGVTGNLFGRKVKAPALRSTGTAWKWPAMAPIRR